MSGWITFNVLISAASRACQGPKRPHRFQVSTRSVEVISSP